MNTYQSRYAIGERVIAMGSPGKVIAITFTVHAVLYLIEFDAGGAHSTVDGGEAMEIE